MSTNQNPTLLKVVFGLVSSGFTVVVIILSNMWGRMDRLDDKFERLIEQSASNKVAAVDLGARMTRSEDNIAKLVDFTHHAFETYYIEPKKVRVERERIN